MDSNEETHSSSNIASSEIDEETVHKLRGDAIGDTMYSEVFVLNTLMQFSDLKWSREVEDNLCFLWDMTEEKDVCEYLFTLSYPQLACSAIINYNEPRFLEIVVGIFANILCAECDKTVKEEEIKIVLNLLDSNDPYILIQVMRFVQAVSFKYDKLMFITDEHMGKFSFILYNSTNKELVVHTLKALVSVTDDLKLNEAVIKGQLLMSAITGYKLLKENADCETKPEIFESQEQHTVMKYLIQFWCNIIQHQSVKYDLFPLSPLSRHRLSIVKRKVLVLDLDETLIHSHHDGVVRQTVRPGTPPDFVLKVVIDRHPVRFFVHKRPHVDFFLDIVSQWYELVVFTASMEIYGAAVADRLDAGRGILQRRFYRQHCTPDLGSYTKDLGAICNDLSSVFILDNSPGAYRAYPDNAIPIKSWFSDPTDVALLNLLPVLDALRFTADVRSVLSRNLHLHRLCRPNRTDMPVNSSFTKNHHRIDTPSKIVDQVENSIDNIVTQVQEFDPTKDTTKFKSRIPQRMCN